MAKRRANGEGNIRKRNDGRWEGRYTAGYNPDTGKRIIKNVLGKTQAEVKEKLKTAISESQRLDISKAGNYTVAAWVRTWYEVYAEPRIRPNTKEYYANYIENHIVPGIGEIMLDRLTTIQIQRFYNNLQKNGRVHRKGLPEPKDKSLSPRVVRGVHTLLSNCLEQAVAERLILVNPAQGCKLPKLEKREMHILPQEKIGMYLAEAERRGLLAAFYLELTTGLRRGELLALQWSDLDFKTGRLRINKQVYSVNGKLEINEPKTKAAVRTVILPPAMVELLAEYKMQIFSEWMFPSRIKPEQPVDPGYVRKRLQVILERAGCKRVRFHDLRHTFATMSLENGMDVKTLSAIIGHVSSATTLNIYTHVTDEMQRNAARNIDQGIAGAEVKEEPEREESAPPVTFTPYQPAHRRPGTGCISQINDHLFEGRYSPKWIDGKKHARNIYAHTREECEEKLAALIVQMKRELAELKAAQAAGTTSRH